MPFASPATGGIVLCGGLSSRMGRPKAWLPFGPEFMLPRVVRILSEVVAPIVVIAAVDQELPPLPEGVRIVRDEYEAAGPLAGLATGLAALQGKVELAYASACDVPLLQPAFVREIISRLADADMAIPHDGTYYHPLAAVYRTNLEPKLREMLAAGERRPAMLVQHVNSLEIDVQSLLPVDFGLQSLRNINTPEEYAAALHEAGFTVTP